MLPKSQSWEEKDWSTNFIKRGKRYKRGRPAASICLHHNRLLTTPYYLCSWVLFVWSAWRGLLGLAIFIDDVYWMALSLLALDFIVWAFPYYIDPSFLSPEPPGSINLWKWWGNDQSSYGVNTWDHRPLNIYWLLHKTSTFLLVNSTFCVLCFILLCLFYQIAISYFIVWCGWGSGLIRGGGAGLPRNQPTILTLTDSTHPLNNAKRGELDLSLTVIINHPHCPTATKTSMEVLGVF